MWNSINISLKLHCWNMLYITLCSIWYKVFNSVCSVQGTYIEFCQLWLTFAHTYKISDVSGDQQGWSDVSNSNPAQKHCMQITTVKIMCLICVLVFISGKIVQKLQYWKTYRYVTSEGCFEFAFCIRSGSFCQCQNFVLWYKFNKYILVTGT